MRTSTKKSRRTRRALSCKNPYSKYPLVLIHWSDSAGRISKVWKPIEDLQAEQTEWHCWSIGWMVHRTAKLVTIAPHVSDTHDASGEMSIPVGSIQKMVRL